MEASPRSKEAIQFAVEGGRPRRTGPKLELGKVVAKSNCG
jgi:hypothetical protein